MSDQDDEASDPVNTNEVSDPLKHLLSLDWEQTAECSGPKDTENDVSPTKTMKKVRFSDEIDRIALDKMANVFCSAKESMCNKSTTNVSDQSNEISPFSDQASFDLTKYKSFSGDISDFTGKMIFVKSDEVSFEVKELTENKNAKKRKFVEMEANTIGNLENINSLLHSLNLGDQQNAATTSETFDENSLALQIECLQMGNDEEDLAEDLLSKQVTLAPSCSFGGSSPTSDLQLCPAEEIYGRIILLKEKEGGHHPFLSFQSQSSPKASLHTLKQTASLNYLLKRNLNFTEASELKSLVYDAWSNLKKCLSGKESVFHSSQKHLKIMQKPAPKHIFSVRRKSTVKIRKNIEKSSKEMNLSNDTNQSTVKNDENESEMAFLSWKKSKDRILRQQSVQNSRKQRDLRLMIARNQEERRIESERSLSSWKEKKTIHLKLKKIENTWIMTKKKGSY